MRLSAPGVRWADLRTIKRDILENLRSNCQEAFDKIYEQILDGRRYHYVGDFVHVHVHVHVHQEYSMCTTCVGLCMCGFTFHQLHISITQWSGNIVSVNSKPSTTSYYSQLCGRRHHYYSQTGNGWCINCCTLESRFFSYVLLILLKSRHIFSGDNVSRICHSSIPTCSHWHHLCYGQTL